MAPRRKRGRCAAWTHTRARLLRPRRRGSQVFATPSATKDEVLEQVPGAVTQLLAEIQHLNSRVIELEKRKSE